MRASHSLRKGATGPSGGPHLVLQQSLMGVKAHCSSPHGPRVPHVESAGPMGQSNNKPHHSNALRVHLGPSRQNTEHLRKLQSSHFIIPGSQLTEPRLRMCRQLSPRKRWNWLPKTSSSDFRERPWNHTHPSQLKGHGACGSPQPSPPRVSRYVRSGHWPRPPSLTSLLPLTPRLQVAGAVRSRTPVRSHQGEMGQEGSRLPGLAWTNLSQNSPDLP